MKLCGLDVGRTSKRLTKMMKVDGGPTLVLRLSPMCLCLVTKVRSPRWPLINRTSWHSQQLTATEYKMKRWNLHKVTKEGN